VQRDSSKSQIISKTPRPVILSEFGPPALACIRSWGKSGFSVGMICVRSRATVSPDSRYLASYCSLSPKDLFTENGIRIISDYLDSFGATCIIAINEKISCWLNDNRHQISSSVLICAPPNDVALSLLSKSNQLNVARELGFDALPTYHIDKDLDSSGRVLPIHFPLCIRPNAPNTIHPGFKVRIEESPEKLRQFVNGLQKVDVPMLAQPFADLPNLVVHGARTIDGEVFGLAGFLVDRKFQGVTLTLRPYSIDKTLQDKCSAFADRFKITGSFHFEFLLDLKSNRTLFLELNARLGGTTAKVYACGYNEPLLALSAYAMGQFKPSPISQYVVSGKHALAKYMIYALTRRLSALDYPNESTYKRLIKSIYGLIAFKDEILNLTDIRGSLAFYRSLLCRS
jgi:hypothetical protein